MFKFFRKIRRSLLAAGKTRQYVKYALGEIALVVIGILIALQINNWNQNRIDEKNERIYLIGLKEEFQISKRKLQELIAVNRQNYQGAQKILAYATSGRDSLNELTLSNLLYQTFSADIAFNPNNSFLQEMINSGNLKTLSNPALRTQLTNWISTLEDISRQEEELGIQRVKVLDRFRTNDTSLRTIFIQAGVDDNLGLPAPADTLSNLPLLDSTAFENNVLMFLITSQATEQAHYQPLMKELEAIVHLIDQELE